MKGELYELFIDRTRRSLTIHKWHHYFPIYEQWFAAYRGKPCTLLEIGVQNGGSLELWRKFFGSEALIVGIDVDPRCKEHDGKDEGRTRVFIGDQSDTRFLSSVLEEIGQPAIVIDDGSHYGQHQVASFEFLYPRCAIPGLYIVEDTHTAFWAGFGQRPDVTKDVSFLDFAHAQVLKLHDWTKDRQRFDILGIAPDRRPAAVEASDLCKTTRSITFHDSMVVFDRAAIREPYHQYR